MRRRDVITLLGGAAAAWPLAARAQAARMRRIGVLTPFTADDAEGHARLTAFAQGLQQLGWTVGQNIRIDYRWGDGKPDTMRKFADELVSLAPDVILANSSAAVSPLLQATRIVPIVFAAVADPVGAGYVESLARPGGNATGFTALEYSIAGKWLELLKEIAPRVTRVAVFASSPSRPAPAFSAPSRPGVIAGRGVAPDRCARFSARSNVPSRPSREPEWRPDRDSEARRRRLIAISSSSSRPGTGCLPSTASALSSQLAV